MIYANDRTFRATRCLRLIVAQARRSTRVAACPRSFRDTNVYYIRKTRYNRAPDRYRIARLHRPIGNLYFNSLVASVNQPFLRIRSS